MVTALVRFWFKLAVSLTFKNYRGRGRKKAKYQVFVCMCVPACLCVVGE